MMLDGQNNMDIATLQKLAGIHEFKGYTPYTPVSYTHLRAHET